MIATNNGSFPPPSPVDGETVDAQELDRRTRGALDAQVSAGCDLVTDGLYRRADPVSHVAAHLGGVVLGESKTGFPGSGRSYRVPVVAGEIAWRKPVLVEDFLFAKTGCPKPVKPVLAGPYTLSQIAVDQAYDDRLAMAMGFAIALNTELKALQEAGATWVQIEEPALLAARQDFPSFTRLWEVLGRGIKLTLCLHLEGGDLGELYPGVTQLKRLGCLSLDCVRGASSLRLFESSPFPAGVRLGLGLIDGTSERVEDPGEIVSLLRATRGLPASDMILLGTASDLGGLSHDAALAKLRALAAARDLA